jgi:hypothetical protein
MKMILQVSTMIMLLQIGLVSAADWEKILDRSKDTIYVDLDSYATSDGHPSILIKSIPKPTGMNADANAAKLAVKTDRFQFDCNQHQVRKITHNNEPLDSRKNSMMQFRPVAPNSLDQEIESLVCQVNKMVGGL